MNMLSTIIPKSDQLNSDDLISGPRTITVTKVTLLSEEQPVAVYFEGDTGRPFKPGKSMRRVMVNAWGPDANAYAGRSMTLYRDEKVAFGGMEVGGIRISHMSHIDGDIRMALTATKGKKKMFTVQPLVVAKAPTKPSVRDLLRDTLAAATSRDDVADAAGLPAVAKILRDGPENQRAVLQGMLDEAFARFPADAVDDDAERGEYGLPEAAE